MDKIFIELTDESTQLKRIFNNKDFVTIEELIDKICDLDDEIEDLREEKEDE